MTLSRRRHGIVAATCIAFTLTLAACADDAVTPRTLRKTSGTPQPSATPSTAASGTVPKQNGGVAGKVDAGGGTGGSTVTPSPAPFATPVSGGGGGNTTAPTATPVPLATPSPLATPISVGGGGGTTATPTPVPLGTQISGGGNGGAGGGTTDPVVNPTPAPTPSPTPEPAGLTVEIEL